MATKAKTRAKKRAEPGAKSRGACAFAEVVQERRKALGLTWRQLSDLSGLNSGSISRALAANGEVGVGQIEAIADALGVTPSAFWRSR